MLELSKAEVKEEILKAAAEEQCIMGKGSSVR
jgi:hypothetical protein